MPSTAHREIFKAYDIRGLYGEQIDGDVAEQIGRAFARVLGGLRGKPSRELRVGLGRDMRLTAPELAARYRDGHDGRGRARPRRRDGRDRDALLPRRLARARRRADVHRLAQPEGLHGREAGRARARWRCRGDAGIGDIRDARRSPGCPRRRPRRGSAEDVDVYAAFQARALEFVDPARSGRSRSCSTAATGWPGRWSARSSSGCRPRARPDLLDARRLVPRPRAEPAAAREPELRHRQGPQRGRRPRHRLGRRRRPLLLHRRRRRLRRRRLPHRAARAVRARDAPGRGDPLRRPRVARGRRHRARPRAACALVNRVGHAFFKARMREEGGAFGGEVSGHYYFADFFNADSGTLPALLILELLGKCGRTLAELLAPYRERYFISGEINSEVADPHGRIAAIARPLRRRARSPSSTASPSTTTTGTSTCGCRTPSRCCACASRASSRTPTWRPGATRCSP